MNFDDRNWNSHDFIDTSLGSFPREFEPRSGMRFPSFRSSAALFLHGGLQQILPKGSDFPYAFFYLIAAFASAWYGGYVSGALACLFIMVGLPAAGTHFSRMPPVDPGKLTMFIGVSLLISRVAQNQRRAQEMLRKANDELDRRVHERTRELACAVEQLQSEIAGHRKTEAALRESEDRVAFSLEAAGIGRWDLDLVTGRANRSLRHDQVFGYDALLPEWTYDMMLEHVLPEDRPQCRRAVRSRHSRRKRVGFRVPDPTARSGHPMDLGSRQDPAGRIRPGGQYARRRGRHYRS